MKYTLLIIFVITVMFTQAQNKSGYSDNNRQTTGWCLTIGGLGFTTAATLEGGYSYGTNIITKPSTSTASQQVSYVIPPFYRQTPRNIMFTVGVGLTITGLLTALSK
jgi:hypothetical protein